MAKKIITKRMNRIRLTTGDRVYQVAIYTIVTLFTLMCFVPLIYVIGMSFTSEGEMIARNYFVIIPRNPILKSYHYVFRQDAIWTSFAVSTARTILGVCAMLTFVIPGGYILAKEDMPGRRFRMIFMIITMIISGGIIPSYMLIKSLGLLDSFWVYIVPAFGGTYNMLIVKIFVENIPADIVESADLDGASEWQKMRLIAVPLLIPTITALSLFAGVGHWNSWFDALLYVTDTTLKPLSLRVREMMTQITQLDTQNANVFIFDKATPEGVKMASVVVAVVPIMCVYPFLQKYFIYGMYTGSVKG